MILYYKLFYPLKLSITVVAVKLSAFVHFQTTSFCMIYSV